MPARVTAVLPFDDAERNEQPPRQQQEEEPPPKLVEAPANHEVGGLAAQIGDRKTRERFARLLLAVFLALGVLGDAVSRAQSSAIYSTLIVLFFGLLIVFLQWAVLLPPGCSPWPLQCWCCGRRQFFCHT